MSISLKSPMTLRDEIKELSEEESNKFFKDTKCLFSQDDKISSEINVPIYSSSIKPYEIEITPNFKGIPKFNYSVDFNNKEAIAADCKSCENKFLEKSQKREGLKKIILKKINECQDNIEELSNTETKKNKNSTERIINYFLGKISAYKEIFDTLETFD